MDVAVGRRIGGHVAAQVRPSIAARELAIVAVLLANAAFFCAPPVVALLVLFGVIR